MLTIQFRPPSGTRIRPVAVIENGVLRREVRRVRIGTRVNVLRLDWDDAAVVSGESYFLRRVVCDGRERQQVRFALPLPVLLQTRDQHFLGQVGPEFQDQFISPPQAGRDFRGEID